MASYVAQVANATLLHAVNPSSALKAASLPADLYAGLDFASLSLAEQYWVRWYMWIGDPVLATGLMSFLMHELVYFGRCLPWVAIGRIRYFDKWKLQEEKVPTAKEQWECTKYVLYTHFTIELPQIWGFHPLAEALGMSTHQVPFPAWSTMAYQIVLFFFFEDFFHYWAHRALHQGALYQRIHKLHHEFSAPFGLAAEYAHPLEILILGMGTVGGPLLWSVVSGGNLHILTVYVWIVLRLFQAVDAHSGYDFPWDLRHFLPIWSGAEHHDHHHQYFVGNYSTSFRIWDALLGTDALYKRHLAEAKEKAAKLGKSVSDIVCQEPLDDSAALAQVATGAASKVRPISPCAVPDSRQKRD